MDAGQRRGGTDVGGERTGLQKAAHRFATAIVAYDYGIKFNILRRLRPARLY